MLAKLFGCESSIAGDAAHGVGVNRNVARNGVNALPVGHDDVLSLTSDTEVEFLKHPDGIEMIDARDLRHELGDLDLADHRVLQQLVAHGKVTPGWRLGCWRELRLPWSPATNIPADPEPKRYTLRRNAGGQSCTSLDLRCFQAKSLVGVSLTQCVSAAAHPNECGRRGAARQPLPTERADSCKRPLCALWLRRLVGQLSTVPHGHNPNCTALHTIEETVRADDHFSMRQVRKLRYPAARLGKPLQAL